MHVSCLHRRGVDLVSSTFWTVGGKLVVDGSGKLILCATCPCPGDETVSLPCCDSFGTCCDASVRVKKALFATVVIEDTPGGTILATFSVPITYTTTANYNGSTRTGWFGCAAKDFTTQCVTVATVFLQCESGEFKISFNGFTVGGHTLCDGFISTVGLAGTTSLVCSPFSISSVGVSFSGGFSSPGCGDIFVTVNVSE